MHRMSHKIRIVSDLHIGHRASSLDCPSALRALAEGVDRVVFNGDTLELKYAETDAQVAEAERLRRRFEEEIASWGIETTVLTGNHDPAISEVHQLSLCGGAVWVTHGDGLFPDIAPWSSNAANLRRCAQELRAAAPPEHLADLDRFLGIAKAASIQAHLMDLAYNPTLWGKAKIFLHQAWPPTRPLKILQCWRELPDRAVAFAARFGLQPRFIILGHTHNPRVWRRGGQVVINLGSFFPWPGARCVDIADGKLSVRRLRSARGKVVVGKVVASFPLEQR